MSFLLLLPFVFGKFVWVTGGIQGNAAFYSPEVFCSPVSLLFADSSPLIITANRSRAKVVPLPGVFPSGKILASAGKAEAPTGVGVGLAGTADATVLFENRAPGYGGADVFRIPHEELVGVFHDRECSRPL